MTAVEVHQPAAVDRAAILSHLKLNPNDVGTQALLLICERYGLDPLLKHVVLISGRPYITRDGYLHLAHQSGHLDGIEVVEEGESTSEWWAKVAVYRRDMSRPFAYRGRYPKSGQQKQYGPEMAVKTAEVMALRRAFDVTGASAADERWDDPEQAAVPVGPPPVLATKAQRDAIRGLVRKLTDSDRERAVTDDGRVICAIRLLNAENQAIATEEEAQAVIDTLSALVDGYPGEPEGVASEQTRKASELADQAFSAAGGGG